MMPFLILGLPRNRTAWLANFMTIGDIRCMHEGLNGCHSLTAYRDKFQFYDGDSNTGLAMFEFEPLFTGFKKVIIDNTIDRSVAFSKKYFAHDSTKTMDILRERLSGIDGLHIHFNDINKRLGEIWRYLTVDPYDHARAEMLIGLNVQVHDIYNFDPTSLEQLRQSTRDYFPR